jgi:hypothetical protein
MPAEEVRRETLATGSRLMQLKIDENVHADAADLLSQDGSMKRTEMEDV